MENRAHGRINPFSRYAQSARIPTMGCPRTTSVNITDLRTIGTSTDATTSSEYIYAMITSGLEYEYNTGTVDNAVVTAFGSGTNSNFYNTVDESSDRYRVVCSAVHIQYTGPLLSCQGSFRIFQTPSGDGVTTYSGNSPWPKAIGNISGQYIDISADDLRKGYTVFMRPNSPDAKVFQGPDTNNSRTNWNGVCIFGYNLDSSGSILVNHRQTIEFVPEQASVAALAAKPTPAMNGAEEDLISTVTDKFWVIAGGVAQVTGAISNIISSVSTASSVLTDFMGTSAAVSEAGGSAAVAEVLPLLMAAA
jgi:hypothetical protein